MSGCCEQEPFDGVSQSYKRALMAVIVINAVMFFVEMTAGFTSGSQALKADALDFAADAATYTLSFIVIGMSLKTRARAALIKGGSLAIMAMIVLIMTFMQVLDQSPPQAETMGLIGFAAMTANLLSVFILLKWRDGDSNVRSVWLCSRNDAIGNVGVIIAGVLVAFTGSAWPYLLMAIGLASLFLRSSYLITVQARQELNQAACDLPKMKDTRS